MSDDAFVFSVINGFLWIYFNSDYFQFWWLLKSSTYHSILPFYKTNELSRCWKVIFNHPQQKALRTSFPKMELTKISSTRSQVRKLIWPNSRLDLSSRWYVTCVPEKFKPDILDEKTSPCWSSSSGVPRVVSPIFSRKLKAQGFWWTRSTNEYIDHV